MADEVRVSTPGPNGNGFLVDLKEKKAYLTGPNVALLLLIIIVGYIAYTRTGAVDKGIKAGQEQLAATESRVHGRVSELFGRIDKLLDDLQAQNVILTANNAKVIAGQNELRTHVDTALRAQDDRTHAQIATMAPMMADLKQYTEDWFTEMGKRLEVMNFNVLHPDRALPLRSPLSPDEPHQERRR